MNIITSKKIVDITIDHPSCIFYDSIYITIISKNDREDNH